MKQTIIGLFIGSLLLGLLIFFVVYDKETFGYTKLDDDDQIYINKDELFLMNSNLSFAEFNDDDTINYYEYKCTIYYKINFSKGSIKIKYIYTLINYNTGLEYNSNYYYNSMAPKELYINYSTIGIYKKIK